MSRRQVLATAVIASAAAAVTGCGGDGPRADAAGPGGGAGSPAAEGAATGPSGGASASAGGVAPSVRGHAPPAAEGLPSIVTLTPVDGGSGGGAEDAADQAEAIEEPAGGVGTGSAARRPARGADAVIDQFGLAFSPGVLVVAAGSPVRFTNSEGAITHNVHIRSIAGDSTAFNGDTGPSEGIDVELPGPAAYDVLCDMHPGMTAFVYVTDAPYAVAAEIDGSFALGPVPPGEYTARVWTAADGLGPEQTVTVEEGTTDLDLRQPS